jgi:hypothetical protein
LQLPAALFGVLLIYLGNSPLPGDENSEEDGAAEAHVVQRIRKPQQLKNIYYRENIHKYLRLKSFLHKEF